MNRAIRRTAEAWLAHGRDAVIVTVIEARGARAVRAGTRMLVSEGQRVGSIGGGHLELQSTCLAEELLAVRAAVPRQVSFPIGPSSRHGVSVRLGFARLDATQLAAWPAQESLFHLQLYDGGQLGWPLTRILATLDCSVDWVECDDEGGTVTPPNDADAAVPERIRRYRLDVPAVHVGAGTAGGFYLVMTQDPQLDLTLAEAILRRGDFGFFGLLGSHTQRLHAVRRLSQRGISPEALARMTSPVGVDGISSKKPEALAISIAAQLLQRCRP